MKQDRAYDKVVILVGICSMIQISIILISVIMVKGITIGSHVEIDEYTLRERETQSVWFLNVRLCNLGPVVSEFEDTYFGKGCNVNMSRAIIRRVNERILAHHGERWLLVRSNDPLESADGQGTPLAQLVSDISSDSIHESDIDHGISICVDYLSADGDYQSRLLAGREAYAKISKLRH